MSKYDEWISKEELKRLYAEHTSEEIAKMKNIKVHTVRHLIERYGIRKPKFITKEYLLKNYQSKTQKEMAEELGTSQQVVCAYMKMYDIKIFTPNKYKQLWYEFKDYLEVISPSMYKKMIELEETVRL